MRDNENWHRHLGAYGICVNEGSLLVIHKGDGPYIGRYDLPGGTVEPKESLTEAIEREFVEEAGIRIVVKHNIGVCDYLIPHPLPKKGTTHIHHVAVYYWVGCISGRLITYPEQFDGQDSLGALWVPIDDFNEGNSSPLVLQAVEWHRTNKLPHVFQRLDDWVVNSIKG